MAIQAREVEPRHLGQAISIPGRTNAPTLVLCRYVTLLVGEPYTGASRVDLMGRDGRWHSLQLDEPIAVERE